MIDAVNDHDVDFYRCIWFAHTSPDRLYVARIVDCFSYGPFLGPQQPHTRSSMGEGGCTIYTITISEYFSSIGCVLWNAQYFCVNHNFPPHTAEAGLCQESTLSRNHDHMGIIF